MAYERIFVTACFVTCLLIQTQCADKYTDENRPYEFGFSIEGEQHRHEQKDEKGIIMGEFGFITADGVYHVTVYATDEQGRFKILSMKNIRTKPYPTFKANTSSRQGHSLNLDTPQQEVATPVSSTTKPFKRISIEPPKNSCSSCSIPTTTKAPIIPPISSVTLNENGPQASNPQGPIFPGQNNINSQYPQNKNLPTSNNPQIPSQNTFTGPQNQVTTQRGGFDYPQQELQAPLEQQDPRQQQGPRGQQGPPDQQAPLVPGSQIDSINPLQNPQIYQPETGVNYPQPNPNLPAVEARTSMLQGNSFNSRTPKRLDNEIPANPQNSLTRGPSIGQGGKAPTSKPVLISAQMQIVDKNTDIYKRGPGEKEGLPDGLTKNDMSDLLYTFNYTVGFHGHFEEGYTNGAKQGYYFVTGRNGVRTRIDYVADENGFRPKITQELLDLLSDDVPKPETEKDAKYGLKGYEFKWLYYPIESKGR